MGKKYRIVLIAVILVLGLLQLPSCLFDPDPGPDATGDDGVNAEADGDTDTDTDAGCPPFVYDSASDYDDSVTVVGLEGAAHEAIFQVHAWSDSPGDTVLAPVGENNSFAFRIEAREGDLIFLDMDPTAIAKQLPVAAADETLEIQDIFDNVTFSREDHETILVSGTSNLLEEYFWVLGGNVTQSIGAATPVECQVECGFEFSIQGETGDEIDLFLMLADGCSGLTPAYALTVPDLP